MIAKVGMFVMYMLRLEPLCHNPENKIFCAYLQFRLTGYIFSIANIIIPPKPNATAFY